MLQRSPSSFTYRKAMAQQEPGGKTWCVVRDVVKHRDGQVTSVGVAQGLCRTVALVKSKSLNRKAPQP